MCGHTYTYISNMYVNIWYVCVHVQIRIYTYTDMYTHMYARHNRKVICSGAKLVHDHQQQACLRGFGGLVADRGFEDIVIVPLLLLLLILILHVICTYYRYYSFYDAHYNDFERYDYQYYVYDSSSCCSSSCCYYCELLYWAVLEAAAASSAGARSCPGLA